MTEVNLTYDFEIGKCENCLKKISDQERSQNTQDWVTFCEGCAYTYQDALDQYKEIPVGEWPEGFDNEEEFLAQRDELSKSSTEFLNSKPLYGPEVTTPKETQ